MKRRLRGRFRVLAGILLAGASAAVIPTLAPSGTGHVGTGLAAAPPRHVGVTLKGVWSP
jgi:hypothetical protein